MSKKKIRGEPEREPVGLGDEHRATSWLTRAAKPSSGSILFPTAGV